MVSLLGQKFVFCVLRPIGLTLFALTAFADLKDWRDARCVRLLARCVARLSAGLPAPHTGEIFCIVPLSSHLGKILEKFFEDRSEKIWKESVRENQAL